MKEPIDVDGLTLEPEPDNEYDKNAIAWYYNDQKLGYVPAEETAYVKELLRTRPSSYQLSVGIVKQNGKGQITWVSFNVDCDYDDCVTDYEEHEVEELILEKAFKKWNYLENKARGIVF